MSELFKYILRTFSLADSTRISLTIFLLYLVSMEGLYTAIALSIVYFRYELETFVNRWKLEVLPDQLAILQKMSKVLDIVENNENKSSG